MHTCFWRWIVLVIGVFASAYTHSNTSSLPEDPLRSPTWDIMYKTFLNDGTQVVFDDRVHVLTPDSAEDSLAVPVAVRVEGLTDIEQVLVFSDLNPIPQVLRYFPPTDDPYIAFRMKLQQASPIRAAVKTRAGRWHVGGKWIDTMGGGCTAPSVGISTGNWADTLGEVSFHYAPRLDGARLRFRVMHPMDTGLAPGIPAFYIEYLELRNPNQAIAGRIELYEPVSENPVFSLNLPQFNTLSLVGVDNNGNPIEAMLSP